MNSYHNLDAWKVGIKLLKEIYKISNLLPKNEQYALCVQIQKAATSILANIAEGFGRYTYKDKANKYIISRGECYEVDAFICMIIEIGYLTKADCKLALELVQKERMILSGLIKKCYSYTN